MNHKYIRLLVLVFLTLMFSTVFGQNYLWPTDASTFMSSSFGEYRSGHYHSAIDIKTWLQEGYKCFAIEDGKIERINVSPFGYGKVLYLRLKDGNTAVYAHLQRFSNKVEKEIRKKQLKSQQYQISWYPKDMYVKKGDVIAYTGRTGIGVPHFHFEIRNKNGHPINPLNFYSQVKDTIRPRLSELGIVPLTTDAKVNLSGTPCIIELKYIRNGTYVLNQPIYVKGRIGLIVNGYDQANDVGNKYGFNDYSLELDGKEIFRSNYKEIHFETTAHINSEIFYPLLADRHKVFQKLYIESYNPLPFYTPFPGEDGTFIIDDKSRDFQITIRDFHGNQSIIKGELMPDLRPAISVQSFSATDSSAWLDFRAPQFSELKFFTGESLTDMSAIDYFEIISGKISQPENGLSVKFKAPDSGDQFLKIGVVDREGHANQQVIKIKAGTDFSPDIYFAGNRMILEIPASYPEYRLHINSPGEAFSPVSLSNGNSQFVIPNSNLRGDPVSFTLLSHSDTLWADNLNLAVLMPGEERKISWYDSAFTVIPRAGTFVDTVVIQSEKLPSDSLAAILSVASAIYSLKPGNIPVFQSATIQIKTDSLPEEGHWAIFKTNGLNSVSFVGGQLDTGRSIFTTKTDPFGKFVIACDTIPPVLDIQSPADGKEYQTNPAIRFFVTDKFSGVGSGENVSLLIDGEFVLPEWDPEDDLIFARIDQPLAKGNHVLSISVKDLSDNMVRKAIYFIIK